MTPSTSSSASSPSSSGATPPPSCARRRRWRAATRGRVVQVPGPRERCDLEAVRILARPLMPVRPLAPELWREGALAAGRCGRADAGVRVRHQLGLRVRRRGHRRRAMLAAAGIAGARLETMRRRSCKVSSASAPRPAAPAPQHLPLPGRARDLKRLLAVGVPLHPQRRPSRKVTTAQNRQGTVAPLARPCTWLAVRPTSRPPARSLSESSNIVLPHSSVASVRTSTTAATPAAGADSGQSVRRDSRQRGIALRPPRRRSRSV